MRNFFERIVSLTFIGALLFIASIAWAAYVNGIISWFEWTPLVGIVLFPVTFVIPIIGPLIVSVISFYGAHNGWGWNIWAASIFLVPVLYLPLVYLFGFSVAGIASLFAPLLHRGRNRHMD